MRVTKRKKVENYSKIRRLLRAEYLRVGVYCTTAACPGGSPRIANVADIDTRAAYQSRAF